ncbi:MAG: UDP-3-O-acyl-N-acetylglucosamine deacetylase [Candidatus Omnitrophica bacterium]|nr:UDP-3-O-acyl-N-acetylglucosamine deacetylase [Candidatus Omnitrophota bacterium]
MHIQRTIKGKLVFEGTGLHTGKQSKVELLPASANAGILFNRTDVKDSPSIKADVYSVLDPKKFPRRTSIGQGDTYVHTIEHLMAALHLLKVDNIQVNISGKEIPGLDGSAKEYVNAIRKIGLVEQTANRKVLVLREPICLEQGISTLVALPHPHLRISYVLKYDNPVIGTQYADISINGELTDNFYEARTFCIEDEVKPLLDMGLGKGSNYDNTLVVGKEGVLENKLRFPDEFIKHKVMDLIGDLYLAGPIQAHIIAVRSGHSLNMKLLDKLRQYRDKTTNAGIGSGGLVPASGDQLNIKDIMRILPHRYPFLLVDKVTVIAAGQRAVGVKNVTMNEHFFQGHFPSKPVMPGVLIVEAMAQVGGVLMLGCDEHCGKLAYFMAADKVKFRKTVEPGDQLVMEVEIGRVRSRTGSVNSKAFVDGKLVAEAELKFALVDN